MYLVAKDQQDALSRYVGNQSNAEMTTDIRCAINDALRSLWGEYEWPYYQGQTQFQIDAPYSTGTVTFDLATRRFTLTGGTWPEWAVYGSIKVGTKDARGTKRISDTVLEIEDGSPFIADISSASAYVFYRNEYPVPGNIRKVAYMFFEESPYLRIEYVPSVEFRARMPGSFGTMPFFYTVQRDRNVTGNLVIVFWPYPTRSYTARFNYIRAPNEVQVWDASDGKIATSASGTTVTGSSSAFESLHEGCLLRVGRDGTNLPTNRNGTYPFREEGIIDSVTNATSLELLSAAVYSTSQPVKYLISSLIDIDVTLMSSAFLQQCYFEISKIRKIDGKELQVINSQRMMEIKNAIARSKPRQEITYAGTFQNTRRYYGVWFNVGI